MLMEWVLTAERHLEVMGLHKSYSVDFLLGDKSTYNVVY